MTKIETEIKEIKVLVKSKLTIFILLAHIAIFVVNNYECTSIQIFC